ncbi:MAG: alpha/beta hydrolase family protein [Bryobacteraceae bacterium]
MATTLNSSLIITFSAAALSFGLTAQSPPPQPTTGPGGSNYIHTGVTTLGPYYPTGKQGNDVFKYYIYQPTSPKPAVAPVVLFLHGANANYPDTYNRWMYHIVKKGYTVIWAQYQVIFSSERDYYSNALSSYADALNRIQSNTSWVQPQRDQFGTMLTGFVGHSLGSYVGLVLAGRSTESGSPIPVPRGYFSVGAGFAVAQTDYRGIPASTKIVFLVGADDSTVCKSSTELMWNLLPQIPPENKDFLVMPSDLRGNPDIIADHFFPITVPTPPPAMDVRDFYGTWKLSVATMDCAMRGTSCEYALSNGGASQVSMGNWSDGTPVTTLQWAANPGSVTLPCEASSRNPIR